MLRNLVSLSSLKTRVSWTWSQDYCLLTILVDIERTYGKKKLLAARIPISTPSQNGQTIISHKRSESAASDASELYTTPTATEGESATETDLDTETETELDCHVGKGFPNISTSRIVASDSLPTSGTASPVPRSTKSRVLSQHDLVNRYFRKDLILFHNFDPLR